MSSPSLDKSDTKTFKVRSCQLYPAVTLRLWRWALYYVCVCFTLFLFVKSTRHKSQWAGCCCSGVIWGFSKSGEELVWLLQSLSAVILQTQSEQHFKQDKENEATEGKCLLSPSFPRWERGRLERRVLIWGIKCFSFAAVQSVNIKLELDLYLFYI